MTDTPTSWIVAGFSTAVATLSSALAFMHRLSESKSQKAIEALELRLSGAEDRYSGLMEIHEASLAEQKKQNEICFDDRIKLSREIGELKGQIEVMKHHIFILRKHDPAQEPDAEDDT